MLYGMKRNIEGEKKTVKKKKNATLKEVVVVAKKKRARLLQRVKDKTIL